MAQMMLRGVDAIHKIGIMHRDLKTEHFRFETADLQCSRDCLFRGCSFKSGRKGSLSVPLKEQSLC